MLTAMPSEQLETVSRECYEFAEAMFPICRSISGEGVRQTLGMIQERLPELTIHEVASGTQCFDWEAPDEWNVRDAYVADADGRRVIDFREHNLHIVGYSVPIDEKMSLEELDKHLHSLPDQPDAIPYVTSYYKRRWGFCLTHRQRQALAPGTYHVHIDSTLAPGVLNYGELIIAGRERSEILMSTYVCHPSMANNELSGPVISTALANWIQSQPDRRYTYRIVFVPETIGSIIYLSRNLDEMKAHTIAGFNITCVGDNREYSFLPSRLGNTLTDKIALHVMGHRCPGFVRHSYLDRGSDERQYCSVGVDLPVVSIMRSKYNTYPEYHTSLDDMSMISPEGLAGALGLLQECIVALENNRRYRMNCCCEPQLGKRGLYPTISAKGSTDTVRTMMDFLAYCDGDADLVDIAERIGSPVWDLYPLADQFAQAGLITLAKS